MKIPIPTGEAVNGQILVADTGFFVPKTVIGITSWVSGTDFTTTSTSLVNITGLSFTADPLSWYDVDSFILVQSSSTAGVNVGVNSSDSTSSHNGLIWAMAASPAGGTVLAFNTPNSASSAVVTGASNAIGQVYIKGTLFSIAGGTYTIMIAKTTSGTATVFANGSRLTMTKVKG